MEYMEDGRLFVVTAAYRRALPHRGNSVAEETTQNLHAHAMRCDTDGSDKNKSTPIYVAHTRDGRRNEKQTAALTKL